MASTILRIDSWGTFSIDGSVHRCKSVATKHYYALVSGPGTIFVGFRDTHKGTRTLLEYQMKNKRKFWISVSEARSIASSNMHVGIREQASNDASHVGDSSDADKPT